MRAPALHRVQRVHRRLPVAADAEVVAVDVDRVRKLEVVHRAGDRREHLPGRDAGDHVVERADVAVAALPALDAARVDELDPVAARRLQPPRDRVAHPRRVAADEVEQRLVVAQEHEEERVDHRRVAQLGEDVARGERRRRRLDHRRVAEQRVAIAGDERRRHDAAAARAQDLGPLDGIPAVLLGRQPARGVDLRPGDVRVDVDAARHHDHAARVDPRRVVGQRRRPPCRRCRQTSRTSPATPLAGS